MANKIRTFIVDAFTDSPFKGNPAGVCLTKQELEDELMLSIAKELGLSETAFVLMKEDPSKFNIRFFSPKMEIPLCGHATLASAKVLFEIDPALFTIHFKTIQHIDLTIKREDDNIEMEFPVYETSPADAPHELLNALGINKIINSEFNQETKILLLEIEDSEVLQNLSPDFTKLIAAHNAINGVLVTAKSRKNDYDFESRYFWPWSGTNEDPVTGGTHTFLAKYWSQRLNKSRMNSFQCSERTGYMEVELLGNNKMKIKSNAQIIFQGELTI